MAESTGVRLVGVPESNDLHSGEERASPDKGKKRRLKTPAQVQALERFYNEHKYPSESMKAQVASEIGLSEKQISGWFCHRRLKDKKLLKEESSLNAKPDLSNGFMPDHGSALKQDSCGSTKQGEYRPCDTKEVESRRIYGQDYPAAVLAHGNRSQHINSRDYDSDDTSSGSSAASEGRLVPLRYPSCDNTSTVMNPEAIKSRGYMMASGYLYLQDEIENPAISAVKRKLGRHHREDGPPVGVEFQPLPPGAFDSPIEDPVHEPYYVGDSILQKSHSTRICKETKAHNRYRSESHSHGPYHEMSGSGRSKWDSNPRGPYPEMPVSRRNAWNSDHQDKLTSCTLSRKPSFISSGDYAPDQSSAMEMDDDFVKEAFEFSTKSSGILRTHKSVSSKDCQLNPYEGKVLAKESAYPRVKNDDAGSHVLRRNEYLEAEAAGSASRHSYDSLATTKRLQCNKIAKVGKLCKEKIMDKDYGNSSQVKTAMKNKSKMGMKTKCSKSWGQNYASMVSSSQELPWTKPIKRDQLIHVTTEDTSPSPQTANHLRRSIDMQADPLKAPRCDVIRLQSGYQETRQ
ncbi:hypothetical protein ACLOJK_000486 [Asimina triloba]